MRELDFLGLWEKEIWKKRIAYGVAFLFFFLFLVVLLSSGERKTEKDKVFEYIVCRLNYTYADVDRAYLNCPYQYKGVGYDTATENERLEIKRNGITSFFYPSSIRYDMGAKAWIIEGRRLIAYQDGTFKVKDVVVKVVKSGGFLLQEINE